MRVRLAILATGWAVAIVLGQTAPPATPPAEPPPGVSPRIYLSTTQWDFGTLWWGDRCQTEIEIRNVGHAPLEIRNIKTSCGCTAINPNKTRLEPGETDRIKLSYDTQKGVVDVAQTATIETNDPGQPAITLNIRGQVRNLFDGSPSPHLAFGQTCIDGVQTRSMELTNAYGKPLKLTLSAEQDGPFKLVLDELEPAQRYRLTATTPEHMNPGSQYHHVEIKTDSPEHPRFQVVVSAYAMERVELMPPLLTVYSNSASKPTEERQVRLNYLREKPLKIVSSRSSNPDIQIVVDPEPAPVAPDSVFAAHLIRLTLPSYDRLGTAPTTVEFVTDDPDPRYQKLTLRVTRQEMKPAPVKPPQPSKTGVAPVRNGELPRAKPASQPRKKD